MSRFSRTTIGICTGLLCALAFETAAQAQLWEIGSGPWGGMRYRGPLLSIDIGGGAPPPPAPPIGGNYPYGLVPAPVPPWHYRHDPSQLSGTVREQERFYHDLDRTHRYRTREERYADDFRDRYSSGDPFYHSYSRSVPVIPAQSRPITSVPGTSYRSDGHGRSFVADAEVADLLRPAANRLLNSLSRKQDGALWMQHLQPNRIIAAIDQAEFPGSLTDLVEAYQGVSENPRLVLIAEADGFRDTQRLLSQYVVLQSRFPAAVYPEHEYEVFMSGDDGQPVLQGPGSIVYESATELHPRTDEPPVGLNSAAPQSAAVSPQSSEEIIQVLPTPIGEPDSL
jgi:hypothetical protein